MQQNLKDKFPTWSKTKQQGYSMSITDDLDSLATQTILNDVFNYETNMYVTRQGIYAIDKQVKNHIGVDLACLGNRFTYDNHVTLKDTNSIVNENSANINSIFEINSKDSYFKKCATSTLLQVMSLLDIPLPKNDEGKMFLLSIDSSHLGHYDYRFKNVQNKWLELMELTELIDIQNKYTKSEISNMRFNKKSEYLTFENGILSYNDEYKKYAEKHLGYELYVPTGKFNKVADLETKFTTSPSTIGDVTNDKLTFSCAFTGKNALSYSKYNKIY